MLANGKLVAAIIVLCALLFALARTGVLRYWGQESKPLGEAPTIEFPIAGISQVERQQFLDGDFTILREVKTLSRPVLEAFTEQGGSRLLMANPGKAFEVTDVIGDSGLPRERLIFAGVLHDKCFVHYERGGYVHMYILAFYDIPSTSGMKPLWRGYCTGSAANLQELRSALTSGACVASR